MYLGFQAHQWLDGKLGPEPSYRKSLPEVDLGEWHNYTILIGEDQGIYMIDGVVVATTSSTTEPPGAPMAVVVRINNLAWGGGQVDVKEESLQVDYVRVFWNRETFQRISEEMDRLIPLAGEMIIAAEQTVAGDLGKVKESYEEARDNWDKHLHYTAPILEAAVALCQAWENLGSGFSYAEDLVKGLNITDPQTAIIIGKLNEARDEWSSALSLFPTNISVFCENVENALLDIGVFGGIIEGGCFELAEEHVAGIADDRTRLVMDYKLKQARNAWDEGDYSLAQNYLNQIIDCV
jgi:hypothetical protein